MGREIVHIPVYNQPDDIKILMANVPQYSDDVLTVIESSNGQEIRYRAGNIKEVVRTCSRHNEYEHMYVRFLSGSELEIEKINFAYFSTTLSPEIDQTALQELLQT